MLRLSLGRQHLNCNGASRRHALRLGACGLIGGLTLPRLLELQVAGTGAPAAVSGFLYQLETCPLALAVEQLEIVPRSPDGNELALDLRLSGLCPAAAGKGRAGP